MTAVWQNHAAPPSIRKESIKMLKRLKKKYSRWWQLYVLILLPFVYIIVFKYIPMAGLQMAFRRFDFQGGIWGSQWVGLDNFQRFLTNYQFKRVFINTLILAMYSVLAGFPIPVIFALALNSVTNRYFKKTTQTITYLPHFISTVVLVGIFKQMLHPGIGIYGKLSMALDQRPIDLFASVDAFSHIYVWTGVWQQFGWGSVIYMANLTSVSPELHEAAQIDGATRFQRVMHVDLPALLPTIIITLILRTGSIMSIGFEKVYLMQTDLNLRASEVISTYVYKLSLGASTQGSRPDYSYATAVDLFNAIINLTLITLVNSLSKRVTENSLW